MRSLRSLRSLPSFGPRVPWGLRLLLLAALLLGIVTMHTLGHPTAHSAGHSAGAHGGHDRPPVAQHVAGQHAMMQHAAGAGPQLLADDRHPPGVDPAADGMDPMAVCLAVLAGWTLLLLVAGPLLRRSGDAAAEVRARLLRAVRALPPPGGGRILLARLSVLRQ
ncbi:hypothetical protein [Kitasatospora sp. NPDC086791]|uniref:hypothetical protein n=1 Tax=Kitasatospora sp. NPDC086791 TaxID=3155178 RepID=UPI003441FEDB